MRTPEECATAERVKAPQVGIARKNEPATFTSPSVTISCVASTRPPGAAGVREMLGTTVTLRPIKEWLFDVVYFDTKCKGRLTKAGRFFYPTDASSFVGLWEASCSLIDID